MKKRVLTLLLSLAMVLSLLPATALAEVQIDTALDLSAAVYSTETAGQWTLQGDGSYKYNTAAVTVNGQTAGSWAWYYNSDGTYTLELDGFQVEAQNINSGIKLPNGVEVSIRVKGTVKFDIYGGAIYGAYTKAVNIFGVGEAPSLTCIMASRASTNIYCGENPNNNVCDVKIQNLSLSLSATDGGDENGAILCTGSLAIENCEITAGGQAWALRVAGSVTICNSTLDISNVGAAIMCGGDLSIADTQIDIAIVIDKEHNLEFDRKEAGVGILCAGKADISGQNTQIRIGYSLDESIGSGEEFYFKEFPTNDQLREIYGIPEEFSLGTKSIAGGTYNWDVSGLVQSPPYGAVENETCPVPAWGTVDSWTVKNFGYTITNNVPNTELIGSTTIYNGQEYSAELKAGEGYVLPSALHIYAGSLILSGFTYNAQTGEIIIPSSAQITGNIIIEGVYPFRGTQKFLGGSIENVSDYHGKIIFGENDYIPVEGYNTWHNYNNNFQIGQHITMEHHAPGDSKLAFLGWYLSNYGKIPADGQIENAESAGFDIPRGPVDLAAVYLYGTAKEIAAMFGTNPADDSGMDPILGPYTNDGVTVVFDWDTERWQVTLNNDIQDITLPARTDGELYLTINLNDHNITGSNGTAGNPNGKTALTLGDGYDLTITGPGEIIGGNGADSATGDGGKGGIGIDAQNKELTLRNDVIVRGGQGGNGAPGENGGDGGAGVTLSAGVELTVLDSCIYGGAGGNGGAAETGDAGDGGTGGGGISVRENQIGDSVLIVSSEVKGGAGGNGGNAHAASGSAGDGGNGGNGIAGDLLDISIFDGDAYQSICGDDGYTGESHVIGGNGGDGGTLISDGSVVADDAHAGKGGNGGNGQDGQIGHTEGDYDDDFFYNFGEIAGGAGGNGGDVTVKTVITGPAGTSGTGGKAVTDTNATHIGGNGEGLEEEPELLPYAGTEENGENGKNGTIRLTADITGPVEIPDNLGEVTIDLNGHDIYGQPGTDGNPDGGDAIIMTHVDGGTGTTLTIIDTSDGEKGVVRGGDGYPGSGADGGNGITVKPDAVKPEINIGAGVTVIGGNGANSTTGDGGNGGSGVDGDVNNNNGAITGGNGGDSDNGSGGSGGSGVDGDVSNNNGAITGGNGGDGKTEGGSGGNGVTGDVDNNGGTGTITGGKDGKITSSGTGSSVPSTPSQPAAAPDPTITVKGLNTVDHVAYIIGYEDGTVRPNGTITRAEIANIFFRLMTDEFRNANWSTDNRFSDVPDNAWYTMAVLTLDAAGIIIDSDDGSFRPNEPITRAELAVMAAQFCTITGRIPATSFKDVSAEHWAADEIALIEYAGWIEGYEGYFRPDDTLTRAEAVTIVNRMLHRGAENNNMLDGMITWVDNNNPEAWYYSAVQEATNSHDYVRTNVLLSGEQFRGDRWTELLEATDWAAMEKAWIEANSK